MILALVFLMGLCFGAPRRHRHNARPTGSLRGRLQAVKQRKAQVRQQLHATASKAHAVLGDIRAVDHRLQTVKDQLDDTTDRLDVSRREQASLGSELVAATGRVARVKQQVRLRLRAIYVQGSGSVLTALVNSSNLGEVASRGYLMRTVAKRDQALFSEYRALQADVASRKQSQDRIVRQTDRLAARQKRETVELAQTRQEKGEMLEGLRQRQSELQSMLAQFESDEREIGSEIAAFEARARSSAAHGFVRPKAFTGRFSKPVDGRIGDTFGMRYHPILHRTRMHEGVDISAPSGTPIHAAADGQVISTSYMRGYGNVVILDHGGGVSTVYAHASRIFCRVGQQVKRGERIAAVGATGLATGPHCHFEVRIGGHAVNPLGRL